MSVFSNNLFLVFPGWCQAVGEVFTKIGYSELCQRLFGSSYPRDVMFLLSIPQIIDGKALAQTLAANGMAASAQIYKDRCNRRVLDSC